MLSRFPHLVISGHSNCALWSHSCALWSSLLRPLILSLTLSSAPSCALWCSLLRLLVLPLGPSGPPFCTLWSSLLCPLDLPLAPSGPPSCPLWPPQSELLSCTVLLTTGLTSREPADHDSPSEITGLKKPLCSYISFLKHFVRATIIPSLPCTYL